MRHILIFLFCAGCFSMMGQESSKPLTKGDFINLTIYNKSLMFRSGYVEGPKKDGDTFSYGLNVGPFTKIKKYWSVGTKFYIKQSGIYVVAYEVTAEDKDQIVDISARAGQARAKRRKAAKDSK